MHICLFDNMRKRLFARQIFFIWPIFAVAYMASPCKATATVRRLFGVYV
jgi:hypothetical protein